MKIAVSCIVGALDTSNSFNQSAYATFIQPTSHGNLTFALSAVNNTGDVFIYFSVPTVYEWIAVGTGSHMAGRVMLIVYKNSFANGVPLYSNPVPYPKQKLILKGSDALTPLRHRGEPTRLQLHH